MRIRELFRRGVIIAVTASLLASVGQAAAAPPGIDTSVKLPPLQQEGSVPGEAVPVRDKPAAETAKKSVDAIPEPDWPGKGRVEVDLPAPASRPKSGNAAPAQQPGVGVEFQSAGKLPVSVGLARASERVRAKSASAKGARLEVRTFGQELSRKLDVPGVVMRVSAASRSGAGKPRAAAPSDKSAAKRVAVRLDYSGFAQAYGANYGARLHLVRLPACALSTPEKPRCQQASPIATTNDIETQQLTAEVALASSEEIKQPTTSAVTTSGSMVVAATADADSSGGTFAATKLSPSGKWSAGGSSGNFNYSYPISVPPVPGGNVPNVGLAYSSQSLDGRTSATNNQASTVGDGWSLAAGGHIERRYTPCSQDLGGNQGQRETGDLCWETGNATLVLGGVSTELVRDEDTGQWRPKSDDGSRIEHLYGATNGDDNGEYWKVTTTDGTQYFLGVNRMPGWAAGDPVTNSAWTVPVYGNDSGEPCHAAEFSGSWCRQAWRWNLDYSIDPQGNVVTYYYGTETNHYGRNKTASAGTSYVRAGYLKRIEYGVREDDFFSATARVNFTMAERCLPSGDITCDPDELNADTAHAWPDVPYDRICAAGESCDYQYAPTFFTRKRLTKITTQVRSGGSWTGVDSWSLRQSFPESGDGLASALWLAGITHTGHTGGTKALPEVVFGGHSMANRVDALEGIAPLTRYRLTSIRNESGGYVSIEYSAPQCSRDGNMPESPESNTMRCYPVWWTPEHATEPMLDWFHKYVVTHVTADGRTGGSSLMQTSYEYLGGAAWAYDSKELSDPERRTWSQWRGYAKVRTTRGARGTTQSVTETLYLRGMDGDRLPGGGERNVWVTDSQGGRVEDHEALAGFMLEKRQFAGTDVVSATIHEPSLQGPTAVEGGDAAYVVGTKAVRGRTKLSSGQWQRTKIARTFNEQGLITRVSDLGDTAVSGDERCTRNTYARNEDAWMLSYASRVRTVALPCSAGPGGADDVLSDVRTSYDGQPYGDPPTRGDITAVQRWNGSEYQTVAETTYDAYGRATSTTDAAGATTTVDFIPDVGPAEKVVTTNPLGHSTTKVFSPAPRRGARGDRAER